MTTQHGPRRREAAASGGRAIRWPAVVLPSFRYPGIPVARDPTRSSLTIVPMKTSSPKITLREQKILAAFEAFLSSPAAQRFRQSDVAELLYPLTSPRSREDAKLRAAKLVGKAAKAHRIARTGHLHWMAGSTTIERTLIDGRVVAETSELLSLKLESRCVAKWAAVDLETGEIFEGSMGGWRRASAATRAAVELVSERQKKATRQAKR